MTDPLKMQNGQCPRCGEDCTVNTFAVEVHEGDSLTERITINTTLWCNECDRLWELVTQFQAVSSEKVWEDA